MEDSTYIICPADSAFSSGATAELHISTMPTDAPESGPGSRQADMTCDAILVFMTIVFILYIRKALEILPLTAGCLLRWKENLNLEFNVKNSRSRDTLAAILYPAVCIMAYRYGIVRTSFLQEIHPAAALAAIAGATVIFMLFRALMSRIMRPSHIGAKTWKAADKAFCTYFIPAAVLSLIVSWIQELCGVEAGTIKMTILYIWGSIWLVFLFRKLQIFKNSCSLLSAILYLCSLEILPMAVLAAAALLP